ncbi:transposon ty3-G gag-pol polyprotein [Tanacetum coccineum]
MQPAGLLQPLPVPDRIWEDVSMDFVEGLPISNGFSVVMVVVDRLSKYAHFVPMRHPFTAALVAREFLVHIVRLHGIPSTIVDAVGGYLQDRDELLKTLRHNLLEARNRMKMYADQHRREVQFKVGDFVYIKLQPYRQTSVVNRVSAKLAPRFFGPYKVLDRVGQVAYRVELPPGSLVHNVFHVSLLKKCDGPTPVQSREPMDEQVLSPSQKQPEGILEERVVQKGKYRPKTEILVKWVGHDREDATWETKWRFQRAYPDFHLEDKVSLSGVDCYVSKVQGPNYESVVKPMQEGDKPK